MKVRIIGAEQLRNVTLRNESLVDQLGAIATTTKKKIKRRRKENRVEMDPPRAEEEWSEDEEDRLRQPGTTVASEPHEDITFASARYWVFFILGIFFFYLIDN